MRQPKFRGFNKETEKWSCGFGWYETDYTDEYLKELKQGKQDAILLTDSGAVLCHIDSMGCFTEAFDDDMYEIYEGDICYFTLMLVENQPTFKGEVEWDKYRFAIRNLEPYKPYTTPLVNLDLFGINARVIGNKFENPELLTE